MSTPPTVAALGTVLSVWAHPDDETYLAAGVMAAARDGGQRVVCASATAGITEITAASPASLTSGGATAATSVVARSAVVSSSRAAASCSGLPGSSADTSRGPL